MNTYRKMAILVFALANLVAAKEPRSLPVTVVNEPGPPKIGTRGVAVEKFTLGGSCRAWFKEMPKVDWKADQSEALISDMTPLSVWLIWDELPRPATEDQLLSARVEIRNAAALAGKGISIKAARATIPVAGVNEQALLCVVHVTVALDKGRGLDMGDGVQATVISIDGGIKQLTKEPGVYPRPATGPAPTTQYLETY